MLSTALASSSTAQTSQDDRMPMPGTGRLALAGGKLTDGQLVAIATHQSDMIEWNPEVKDCFEGTASE
jgi:hypothetical protein